jgi:hypothetical protein
MTRMTALIIKGSPQSIKCYAGGPAGGKYVGWIYYEEDRGDLPGGSKDIRPRPLLNTEAIYGSAKEAIDAMQAIVSQVQGADLNSILS